MKSVREILRQKFQSKGSTREIALANETSKTSVSTYINRAHEAGITTQKTLDAINDDRLREIIFPLPLQDPREVAIDFEYVFKELKKKHVTLKLLWSELSESRADYYKYSRFCDLCRQWEKSQQVSMRISHKAGEKMFVDYAGTTVDICDNKSGEVSAAQIFIACLGASQYTYVEASWSQSSKDFISSNVNALHFYGGSPRVIVPDNLKSAVNVASKYEPEINQSFREFSKYYQCTVIPARAYRPKDKAKVENAVLLVSRWILAKIRGQTFFSLEELNQTLWELLEELNGTKFQKLNSSRKSLFEEVEKAELRALPKEKYIMAHWKRVKVNIDYHISLERCHYSVPYKYSGKELDCRYTEHTVELFFNGQRIASHLRGHREGQVLTEKDHMPKSHREHLEWNPTRIINWGKTMGPFTASCLQNLMNRGEHPELAYKACLGILSLGKRYSKERIERACERAARMGAISYKSIKTILEKNLDQIKVSGEQLEMNLDHENIRGKIYYQ